MKKIQITIHRDGTQRVEVLGATGEACLEFTRSLESRLGAPVGERVLKPEYHETECETEHVRDYEVGR